MSQLRVDNITSNRNSSTAPVIFPYGFEVGAGFALTCSGGINVSGIVSATSFSGNGATLTNLPFTSAGQTLAYSIIL
jgi:hypothetical protein